MCTCVREVGVGVMGWVCVSRDSGDLNEIKRNIVTKSNGLIDKKTNNR